MGLKRCRLIERGKLLVSFYYCVTSVCKKCRRSVRFKTQWKRKSSSRDCWTFEDLRVWIRSARLNFSNVCCWREKIYWSIFMFPWDLCAENAGLVCGLRRNGDEKQELWVQTVWRSWSIGKRRAFDHSQCTLLKRGMLLVCTYVFPRLVCRKWSTAMQLTTQWNLWKANLDCWASAAPRVRLRSVRLN